MTKQPVFGGRRFFEVRSLDDGMKGITLATWLLAQKRVRDFAEKEAEKNAPIRIQARLDLFRGGQAAMLAAGISDHALTQNLFDKVMKIAERKSRAALNNPADRAPDKGDAEPWGRLAAEAPHDGPIQRPASAAVRRRKRPEPQPESTVRSIRPLQPRFDDEDDS